MKIFGSTYRNGKIAAHTRARPGEQELLYQSVYSVSTDAMEMGLSASASASIKFAENPTPSTWRKQCREQCTFDY